VLAVIESNRIYAISKKNRLITTCFGLITLTQFILGMHLTAASALEGGEP